MKLSLPVETLDAARPALEDLRVYDDGGKEMPYLIERPMPAPGIVRNAKSFRVSLNAGATVLTVETGLAQPLDGVTLESPANRFIKSVQIETSADGNRWEMLARGKAIFRQPNGASQLYLDLPAGASPWLRLTVDDRRSEPIPFTGARVHAAASLPVPGEPLPVTIAGREETPGETRLTLSLGAGNLSLATVHLETPEPLFMREVTASAPQVSEDSIREQTLARGLIYRVAVEGQPRVRESFRAAGKPGAVVRIAPAHSQPGQPAAPHHCRARGAAAGLSCISCAATGRAPFADGQYSLRGAALRPGRARRESQRHGGVAHRDFPVGGQSELSAAGSFARCPGNGRRA